MKALITGGTGFIGSQLALRLQQHNIEVTVLGQTNTPAEELRLAYLAKHGLHALDVPLDDSTHLKKIMAGVETVFHLAAAQHEANVPDSHFWRVNVDFTENLLQTATATGVKRFVYGSTIGVYGSELAGVIDEDTPSRPDNIYGVTKSKAEELAIQHSDRLPTTAIRISETYGPGDWRLLKLFRAIAAKKFAIIGSGKNLHQLIYVSDLVDGLICASTAESAVGAVITLAGDERLSTLDMCQTIAEALDKKIPPYRLPLWPLNAVAAVMERVMPPLGLQPPLHRRRLDFFRKSFYLDTARSKAMLHFSPKIDFRQGVHKTADWYRRVGWLT